MYELETYLATVVIKASEKDAPRTIGSHCKYCKAYQTSRCPESQKIVGALKRYADAPATMTVKAAARVLEIKDVLKSGVEYAEALVRNALENGEDIPGFYLGKPSKIRKVNDVKGFVEAVEAFGIPIESTPKISLPKIDKKIASMLDVSEDKAKEITSKKFGKFLYTNQGIKPLRRS